MATRRVNLLDAREALLVRDRESTANGTAANSLEDLLTLPARFSRSSRFALVTLLDGTMVLLSLLFVMTLADGAVTAAFADRRGLIWLFALITVTGFSLIGLNWRSWRCISFQDCVALYGALTCRLTTAWIAWLFIVRPPQAEWLAVAVFATAHAHILVLAMFGMRALRRVAGDFARKRLQGVDASPKQNVLLLGTIEWIKSVAEIVKSDRKCRVRVVGALTLDRGTTGLQVAGIPILGSPTDLPKVTATLAKRDCQPASIIVADEEMQQSAFAQLLKLAGQCDLAVTRGQHPHLGEARPLAISLSDLLDRPEIRLQRDLVERLIRRRRIMVTGAGGTIGSELVRQLAAFGPAELILFDHCEFNLYSIDMHVRDNFPDVLCHGELGCVRDRSSVRRVFERHQPDLVFHAAALKHVPMVEGNPGAGVRTNVLGTRNVADAVCEFGALAMIQISTDKAVNPVGLMGATKRLGELYCQSLDLIGQCDEDSPRFMTVRFGNVLGSSGSLIPLFQRQLADRKPLTVTHPDMERYFMTLGEAVQLILQGSARALETKVHRGTIFVLDMGDPIKIVDIARRMILLAGLRPDKDIPITFIGLRPGEKLVEELFDSSEVRFRSSIPGIIEAKPCPVPLERLIAGFSALERLVETGDEEAICSKVHELVQASARSHWAERLRELGAEEEFYSSAPPKLAALGEVGQAPQLPWPPVRH